MEKIRVELAERSYDIIIGSNILDKLGENLKALNLSPRVAIISNPTVFSLYGNLLYFPLFFLYYHHINEVES